MATTTATKSKKEGKEKKERKPIVRVKRPTLLSTATPEMLDANGLLLVVPPGYDPKKYLAPKPKDFASEMPRLQFAAMKLELVAERAMTKAAELRKRAENAAKYGDPEKRAKVAKLQKLQNMMASLQQQLKEEGIDPDQLGQ